MDAEPLRRLKLTSMIQTSQDYVHRQAHASHWAYGV